MNRERTTSDLYNDVEKIKDELRQLHAQKRIKMSNDSLNDPFVDTDTAVREAIEFLNRAIEAMAWMQTKV